MKKSRLLAVISLLLVLLLGACGTKVTKEEVVDGAFKNSINSLDADMKTEFEINANGQKVNQTIDINMKYLDDPFIAHMKMNTVDGDMELYIDKESAYVIMPGVKEWIKAPVSNVPEFEKLASGDGVKEDLEQLKKFSELFEFKEEKDGYILSVELDSSSTDQEKELVMDVLKESLQDESVELSKVNKFIYHLKLDKKYFLKQVKSDADLDLVMDGESGKIIIKVQADYKEINSVKAFSIPQEVKDSAVESGI
jgi:predicted RND superfamily exporter protein